MASYEGSILIFNEGFVALRVSVSMIGSLQLSYPTDRPSCRSLHGLPTFVGHLNGRYWTKRKTMHEDFWRYNSQSMTQSSQHWQFRAWRCSRLACFYSGRHSCSNCRKLFIIPLAQPKSSAAILTRIYKFLVRNKRPKLCASKYCFFIKYEVVRDSLHLPIETEWSDLRKTLICQIFSWSRIMPPRICHLASGFRILNAWKTPSQETGATWFFSLFTFSTRHLNSDFPQPLSKEQKLEDQMELVLTKNEILIYLQACIAECLGRIFSFNTHLWSLNL